MLAPDTILQNRYRVMRKLGQGGMGAVYEAIDQRVSCLVALKETLVGSSPGARQAFQREAALLANLRHAALPKVMDYFGEGEREFLVMEFIPGHDLSELLVLLDGPFPQEQVVRWAIELLRLLDYLHTREPPILHRDIKPANLKLTKQGEIFLLDFGLAKGVAGQMDTMETSKSVAGYTPLYAPLEQILGQGTDQRSDLYSLGATLYHLLTGQAPVSAPVRFDAVENDRPDPLRSANQLNFRIAPELAICIQNAMALSRKDRPASAGEMLIGLENAAKVVADRDNARRAEATLIETLPGPEGDPSGPLVADKNVQFTVYTPEKIKPEKNYSVLAFAHLSKRRADAAEDEPDPIQEVKDQAARVLGDQRDDYRDAGDASSQTVPRGGELTFVPVVQGLTFSPPSRSFTWRKSVHREEFDVRATAEVDGQTLSGSMTVFLGGLVIAEVDLNISVDSAATPSSEKISLDKAQSARRMRQVFAAYSQRDEQVVAELAHVAPIFGSRFVMDRTHLEPGEDRTEGLQRLIRDADVFQLFWSTNSMRSAETVDEIKYAASLGRPGFILPTYWEDPLPRSPAEGLPPPEIERLQFYRIYPGAISKAASTKAAARLVIMGPAGAEIFLDDERSGSIGRSGRVILKSFPIGQHVLRVTLAGHEAFETLVETTTDSGDQVVQTQLKPARTVGGMAAPQAHSADVGGSSSPGVIACPVCGSRFAVGTKLCGRCGSSLQKGRTAREVLSDIIRSEAMPPAAAVPAQMQSYQAPMVAKRKRGIMMPIYAGAAMVLLVMIVAPVWFMMNQTVYKPNATSGPAATPNAIMPDSRSANTNSSSQSPRTFTNSVGIEFVYVPAGSFMMGSNNGEANEKPLHRVTIKEGFYLGRYEVTQAEWQKVMGNNPSSFKGERLPVESVSWHDSQSFIKKLNERAPDGFKYRLPTEAEWEYACRAGTTGDYAGSLDAMAWYRDNSGNTTHPVGTKEPNAFGLSDMHGNLWEWCEDWFVGTYEGAPTDGSSWLSGGEQEYRVLRGGSWMYSARDLRSAFRQGYPPEAATKGFGFRVVAVVHR